MDERLRPEYERYLASHALKPRKVPPQAERDAALREITRRMYEDGWRRGDPFAGTILSKYEKERRIPTDAHHPAAVALEQTAGEVEATIRTLPEFAEKFRDEVFVGELPTGSHNGEAVKVDGGYLVLVNSGTLTLLQMVAIYLWGGNPDDPGSAETIAAADCVAETLATYIEYGDAFYGPRPVAGGLHALGASLMSNAARKFAVAHEYGHILSGHLTARVDGHAHAEEFEADDIGYRLTLGVANIDDFDLTVIDAGSAPGADHTRFVDGLRQKCLIAAPFVLLTIDALLERFYRAASRIGRDVAPRDDHPSAEDRIERLLAHHPGKSPHYSGFINFPFMLLPHVDRIVERIAGRLFDGQPDSRLVGEGKKDPNDEGEEWFDGIMRCVDAIRQGDYAAATLALADAFEREQTILESEETVVLRRVVRRVLGQAVDLRAAILDRLRERRGIEEFVDAANRDSFLRPHRRHGGPGFSLNRMAEFVPDQKPKGLELVQWVVDDERKKGVNGPAEVHLLEAVLLAWRGVRAQSVSSLEAALAAGVTDADERLARYVELEKTALALDVPLDTQKLLEAVGLKAVADDKPAAGKLAVLVKQYVAYLGVPLGPVAQTMIDAQLPE
jgi:hypothetical protein